VTLSTVTVKPPSPAAVNLPMQMQPAGFSNLPVLVWYLIGSNLFLLLVVALLLYPAIAHVYFGR
jgi:hypothetical protein